MNKIMSNIHNAVQNSRKTIEFLNQNSTYSWVGNYPIALINEVTRVDDQESLQKLKKINFFNAQGFSKKSYSQEEIAYLQESVPTVIKSAYCLCLRKEQNSHYTFEEKFEHDCWKKIQDDEDNFELLLESCKFDERATSKIIETKLRDIIRSAKEIPSLKSIGFVWVATLPQTIDIQDILELYFSDNHIFVEKGRKITYIAWAETLAGISMREFINRP